MVDCKSTTMSNMWFALMEFEKAGDIIKEHKHKFDHCTLLAHGEFQVIKYDKNSKIEFDEIISAPCLIYIEKGKEHSIISKTDKSVACCCHAIYESEQSLFPIEAEKVPVVGGHLKLSLLEDSEI